MRSVLETAILEMGRKAKEDGFCPSDVVKWIYPQAWRHFVPEVEEVMMQLYREDKIKVTQAGVEVSRTHLPTGTVKITLPG